MGIEELLKLANTGSSALSPIGAVTGGIQALSGLVSNIQSKKLYREAEQALNRGNEMNQQATPDILVSVFNIPLRDAKAIIKHYYNNNMMFFLTF